MAILTLRDRLMRSELGVYNQNLTATPAARLAAWENWRQQNAAQIAQLNQLINALKPSQ